MRKRENLKRKRRIEELAPIGNRYYIFCEGTKTEPLYFNEFKKTIESNPAYKHIVNIEIVGLGERIDKIVRVSIDHLKQQGITQGTVWCVYDKDDLLERQFNQIEIDAENESRPDFAINSIWSNQCFEYWMLLHFDYYDSDTHRTQYYEYLDEKLRALGHKKYQKNTEIFNVLLEAGNPKQAIKHSKKRCACCKNLTPSQSVPATKVHELVVELAKYLPADIRNRFI